MVEGGKLQQAKSANAFAFWFDIFRISEQQKLWLIFAYIVHARALNACKSLECLYLRKVWM